MNTCKQKKEKGLLEIRYKPGVSVCARCVFVCVVILSSGSQTSSRRDERRWKGRKEGDKGVGERETKKERE